MPQIMPGGRPEFELIAGGKINSRPMGQIFDLYICGEILGPESYLEYFEVIRNANETDVIRIHINSVGGDMSTAIQFIRVIQESAAHIIASVEGYCMSAATMIFLTAESYEISEHSMFMFHNYSGVAFGKGGEMYDHIVNERRWSEKIINSVYKDFLTPDEIKSILDNKDIWMEGDEVKVRLEKKIEKLTEEAEKAEEEQAPAPAPARKKASAKKKE